MILPVDRYGRSEWIRTTDPCLPKTVLYQAELHSVGRAAYIPPASRLGQAGSALPVWLQKARSMQKSTTSSSARFSGPSGNGARARAAATP